MVVTEMDRIDDIAAGLDAAEGACGARRFALAHAGVERGCAVLASARDVLAVRADYVPDYAAHGTASRFVAAPLPLRITRVYVAPAGDAIAAVAEDRGTEAAAGALTVTLDSGAQHSVVLPCSSKSGAAAAPATAAELEAAAAQLSTEAADALAAALTQLAEATAAYRAHREQVVRDLAAAAAAVGEPDALAAATPRLAALHRQQAACTRCVAALVAAATPTTRPLADLCVLAADDADAAADAALTAPPSMTNTTATTTITTD